MGKKIVGAAFGFVLILAIVLVPFVPVSATASMEQPTPFTKNNGKLEERPITYVIVETRVERGFSITKGDFAKSVVVLTNMDNFGGLFTVAHNLRDINGPISTKYTGQVLSPGETAGFEAELDTHFGQDVRVDYYVMPPTTSLKPIQANDEKIAQTNATKFVSLLELFWMNK